MLSKSIISLLPSILYIFLMFLYAISTLSVSSLSYTHTLSFQFPLNLLINNWKKPFITSITPVTKNCSSKTTSLFLIHLPSISNGCLCPTASSSFAFSEQNPCPSNCTFISSGSNEAFDFWKDDWKLCVETAEGTSIFNSLAQMKEVSCPLGERICGDDPDTAVCVGEKFKCPITSIVVSDTNPDPFQYLEFIEYHDSLRIFIERGGKNTPIVEGLVSQAFPCEHSNIINFENEQYIHPLMKKTEITINCLTDPRWKELVAITGKDFWKGRGEARLPGGPGRESWANIGLYRQFYRGGIRVRADLGCREGVRKIGNAENVYQTTLNTQKINLVVTIAVAIGCMVVYPYLEIMYLLGYDGFFKKLSNEKMKERVRKIKKCIIYALKLLHLPFIIVTFTISFINMSIYEDFYNNQCSDPFTNSKFREAAENLKLKSFSFDISSLTIVSGLVIIDFSLMIWMHVKKVFKEKRKKIKKIPHEIEISNFDDDNTIIKGKKE